MNTASAPRAPFFRRRPSRRAWIVLGVLLAALAVLIALFDWNWFKRPLENAVQARTGRELHIDGDLDVDLGRVTKVRLDRIRFANAAWSKEPVMASADRVEVEFETWPLLLRRQARIPEIRLTKPKLRLETGPATRATGCSATTPKASPPVSDASGSPMVACNISMRPGRPISISA